MNTIKYMIYKNINQSVINQLRRFLILIFLLFNISFIAYSQVDGDYLSRGDGNWSDNTKWFVRAGGAWVACAPGDYPGAAAGAGEITIRNGHELNLDVSPPFAIGSLRIRDLNTATTGININNGQTLSVTGDITLNPPSGTGWVRNTYLYVDNGFVTCNSLISTNSADNDRDCKVRIGTGTLTVNADISMGNNALRNDLTFTNSGLLQIGGNIVSMGSFNPDFNGSTVEYIGSSAQNIGNYTYYNLTTSGGGTKTLVGATTVNNNLTLTSGVLQIGNNDLTITNNASNAIQGAVFDVTNMIETDGTGYLIRNAATTLPIAFPVGAGGYYSPASISDISETSGTINVRTEQFFALGSNYLEKFWDVLTSIGGKTITATFSYDPAEIAAAPTSIYVKPAAGTWQAPAGSQSFGVNNFTITGTTDITNTVTSWTAGPLPGTYFSYQTGDWNTPTTWTSDPGGTTQVGSTVPGYGDVVVILPGRTVTLPADISTANLEININEGGILDMATYAFTSGILELNGHGTLRLASTSFPTVTTNNFVTSDGGTTEYYNSSDFTLPVTQTEYNHLQINAPGIIATQLNNITLNGDLYIKQGTYRINDNTSARRQLIVDGDVLVDAGASMTVGTGVTNTTTNPTAVAEGGTAPFVNYYDTQSHRIVINGDFTNNGNVRFTNLTYPTYNLLPPTTLGVTSGFATVYFQGATDNILTCNGTTDFYNLVLDKGVDQSFSLTIYSSAYSNFRLFGANNAGGYGGGSNPNLNKALWIRTGTLVLQGLTIIPSLSEGTCDIGTGGPNSDFFIPANGALILDGSEVIILSTADDYREVNLAYGTAIPNNGAAGIGVGGCSSFSVLGKFQVNNGYFSTRESGGLITWDYASGQFVITGGTVDAKQFRSAGGGGGLASFDQSGGNFILRGRFQRTPTAYSSINNLKDFSVTTLNTARAGNGTDGTYGTFNLNNAANVYTMSGGTITIYDACGAGGRVFDVLSSDGNINVTGGTLELIPTTGTGIADAAIHYVRSNASHGNLIINRASGTTTVQLNTYPLTVLGNLNITSGVLTANNFDVTVGGNFTVAFGTTYTPGTNWTVLNGSGNQLFTVNLAATLALKKFKIDKPAGSAVSLAGSQSIITVEDSLIIINGSLNDGGKTLELKNSATTTSSYLYNSGVHTGAGKILLSDDDPQIITGDGTGVFQNLEINNTDASSAPVSLGSAITVNGALTLSQDKLFNISTYNLILGSSATIVNAGTNRFIQTAGNAGDGGITKIYSATSSSFEFPLGAASTSHAAAEYSPATIAFGTNPDVFGSITVVPVGYEHPNTTTKGRSLTYFWRVKSSGFTLGSATVTHSFIYSQNDVVTGGDVLENGYVVERFDNTTFTWTNYSDINDVDENTNTIGGIGTSLNAVSYIDGEFTAGDDDATDPFGTPTIYYSRQTGLWANGNTWSLTGHTGAAAGSWPLAGDIAVIGGQDSIYLSNEVPQYWDLNNPDPAATYYQLNKAVVNSASLKIEAGSVLDIQNNPGCNFGIVLNHENGNGTIRIATRGVPDFDNNVTFAFPNGDFSDFNINLGSTELYSVNAQAGTVMYLPNGITTYGNLILSPYGGSNIIFPNNDLLIFGNLITRGENADSWYCPTWNTNYPTAPINRIAKTITIMGDMDIQGGALVWYGNGTIQQDVIVYGDVKVNDQSAIDNWDGSSASMSIGGSLINNAVGGTGGLSTARECDFRNIPLTFFGSNTASVTNTANTPTTRFGTVTINKGTSQADTLIINIGGTLSTLTNNWLTLQNGTLKYSRINPTSDFTITTTSTLTIPSTAGLYIDYPNNPTNRNVLIANAASNNNDLYLNGKLTVRNGNVYIGPTNGTTANNNDIEYSGGGGAVIDISGGSLIVNGQIRRNPATTNGILKYYQSGGAVEINGQNAITSNAKLEICNSGSIFNMSGGTITVVRGGGTTYGDLYIRAESSTVTGGEIIFTQSPAIGPVVDAVQNYILDANVALNNLTITGKTAGTARDATVTILISPLILNGNLTLTNNRSILDMNTNYDINLTVKGGFTNNGSYNHYNNITTFSGGVQTIAGSSATDFYDLVVNPVTSLSLIRNIDVFNDLTLSSGQLLYSIYNINVDGDVINNANYDGDAIQGGIILNGTNQQLISGTGTFGRLELDNSSGARLLNNLSLQKNLRLTTGVLDINEYLLTLGVNSTIEGAGFSSSKMITSNGVFSNIGLRKYFSIYSGGAQSFTYPIGTSGKYTPAVLTYTDNTNVGYIRINNINDNHPGVIHTDNVLDYYWEIESNGIVGFNGNVVFNYLEEDVQVTGANTEADYIAAALLVPGTSWIKSIDDVDEAANTITFNYSAVSSLSGEYTCGIDTALPDQVPEFTSNVDNGNWSDPASWIQTGGDPYVLTGAPNGFIIIIETGDTINTDINYATAYRTTINGRLEIVSPTFGHNLGSVSGDGTLYLERATFPAGRYTDFFDCSGNSTLEYGGSTNYTLVADLYSSVPNLHFTGTGTRTLPNKDLTICTQLLIDGPSLDNSVSNRKLTIQGTMERYNTGAFISGSGAGAIVSFAGSSAQTIGGALGNFTGANDFNHFEIDNTAGLTINNGGAIEIGGNLLLTDGLITTGALNTLAITNTAINCVTPAGGSSTSYVNGPLTKRINQGDNFVFPVGKDSELGNKLELSSTQSGTIDWTVEFFTPNSTYTSFAAPLTYVNSREYWTVSAPSGSQAYVGIDWDPMSDLTPLMTQNGLTDMRVAYDNAGTWTEITSSASGNNNNGTVTTANRITIPAVGSTDFTTACINVTKPRARFNPSGAVCGNEGIPVVFTGSGLAYDYIITYEKGGVLQPAVTITSADIPYTLPTDAIGTTYQLISFVYNDPASPTTGVVDPTIVTSYTLPTTADIGSDGGLDDDDISDCGGTSVANLPGNNPLTDLGLWTIISGTGGSFVDPTIFNTQFNGTNGTTYELEWSITNGGCVSSDTMVVAFPLLPVQPGAFTVSSTNVCRGAQDVIYTVPNDPTTLTYTWAYTGSGASGYLADTDNSVAVDFNTSATSGTLSVTATNGCGTSAARTIDITVNVLPDLTLNVDALLDSICHGGTSEIDVDFTAGAAPYTFTITDGAGNFYNIPATSDDPYTYTTEVLNWIDLGISYTDYVYQVTTVTDNNGCTNTNLGNGTVRVFKIPETGPQYHISNDFAP